MGDVETVVDLMAQVLRPIAEHRGLDTWEQIVAYAAEEWYELCKISEQKPGVLDDLAAQRAESLDKESAELEATAEKLAEEIVELGGERPERIG